ncbi:MAG: ABC transporter ATP-binding protein [Sedimentisphaerales bacterium]|nr:ABC transporter ATP-binding protein [Sedimentisphaerales bacterium]
MDYFRRALQYVFQQYKALILSVICALLVAVLFASTIGAMYPLMRAMIDNEGLDGWINRGIIKHRTGIKFEALVLPETLEDVEKYRSINEPLKITKIDRDGTANQSSLTLKDKILGIIDPTTSKSEQLTHNAILYRLAWMPERSVELLIRHMDGSEKYITLDLAAPPFYAPAARWLLSFLPDQIDTNFKRQCIILMIILILIATILRCFLRFIQEYLINRISFRAIMQLRRDAYAKAVRLSLSYFSQEGFTDTMSRFIQDSNRIHGGITTLFGKTIREPMKMIALGFLAYKINAKMTMIVVLGAPVAGLIINKLGRKMKKATKKTLESWSRMLGHLQGTLIGIKVVKGYHQEEYEEERFRQINDKLLKQQFRMAKIDAGSGPLLEGLSIIAACIGMIFAAYWLTRGTMDTSDFLEIVMLLGAMAESGRKLGNVLPKLQTANASAERVYRLVDAPVESDPPQALELKPLSESLEFKNITFRYPNSTTVTLDNINLMVNAGEIIAVVGPNGSGKTTLLSLIPRFFLPDKGEIYIDGINIAEVTLSSLRRQIGIVTQQNITFNDTIAENIAYGDQNASREQIITAAKRAYAHEFIEQTANGYQTVIGEQGTTLSGGQLQRIAIARAILRDPAILIFDEAMSQIDADSEAKIQKALSEFSQNRTSFIIAHRLSTVIDSDRIIVLDQGQIIAQGTHQELMDSCRLYKQLYEMQFGMN